MSLRFSTLCKILIVLVASWIVVYNAHVIRKNMASDCELLVRPTYVMQAGCATGWLTRDPSISECVGLLGYLRTPEIFADLNQVDSQSTSLNVYSELEAHYNRMCTKRRPLKQVAEFLVEHLIDLSLLPAKLHDKHVCGHTERWYIQKRTDEIWRCVIYREAIIRFSALNVNLELSQSSSVDSDDHSP